ncbi:MAG: ORF6N domain-containing protein [Terriglobales bacterium]
MNNKVTVLTRRIESRILVLRGRKVILDRDLAALYGVEVKRLNEQVKRNGERFPADFMFRTRKGDLRSQIATSNMPLEGKTKTRGGRRYYPFAFTEYGAIMAASVLNSPKAVELSIFVVRAFVRMREAVATSQKIVAKLRDLERKVGDHDTEIEEIVNAFRELMAPPARGGKKIGFQVPRANL